MPNPVYETMTRLTIFNWTVRVWREEPELTAGPDPEVIDAIMDNATITPSVKSLATRLGQLPRVSAVEVTGPDGNGGLFYPDWK